MVKQYIMRHLITILAAGMFVFITQASYGQTGPVKQFHKVIISPYIQVTFIQGDEESVTINKIIVDSNKLYVEVRRGMLWLYLDGAKDFPHNPQNHSLYPDHAVIATVVYKKLDALSLRGEETYLCQSPLSADHFNLRVYGESTVNFTEVHIAKMYTTIYGESTEARLRYMGNPEIVKGIHIGGVDMERLD
jgi:hypothetical protein